MFGNIFCLLLLLDRYISELVDIFTVSVTPLCCTFKAQPSKACVHVCMCIYTCIPTNTQAHMSAHVPVHVRVWVQVCVHVFMYVLVCTGGAAAGCDSRGLANGNISLHCVSFE